MKHVFEYKGYMGSADVSVEDNVLVGRLLFIRDVISYVAETPKQLEVEFRTAVEDYLEMCAKVGDTPDVPCKGSFNVRIGPDRHRHVALRCAQTDVQLNEFVCQAIDAHLGDQNAPNVINHFTVNVNEANETRSIVTATSDAGTYWLGTAATGSNAHH
jgi:predicted HicB family RNase H-like nuclease